MRSVTSPELELLILFPVLNEFRVAEFLYFYISLFLFQFFFLSALHCLFFICGFGLQHWYSPNFLSFSNDSNIYQAIKSFTTKFQANLIMTTLLSGIFFICSFYFVIYYDIISRFFFLYQLYNWHSVSSMQQSNNDKGVSKGTYFAEVYMSVLSLSAIVITLNVVYFSIC